MSIPGTLKTNNTSIFNSALITGPIIDLKVSLNINFQYIILKKTHCQHSWTLKTNNTSIFNSSLITELILDLKKVSLDIKFQYFTLRRTHCEHSWALITNNTSIFNSFLITGPIIDLKVSLEGLDTKGRNLKGRSHKRPKS